MADTTRCPSVGPSDQECIGRYEYHEVHCDRIGTTWRNYAAKVRGLDPTSSNSKEAQ